MLKGGPQYPLGYKLDLSIHWESVAKPSIDKAPKGMEGRSNQRSSVLLELHGKLPYTRLDFCNSLRASADASSSIAPKEEQAVACWLVGSHSSLRSYAVLGFLFKKIIPGYKSNKGTMKVLDLWKAQDWVLLGFC